MNDRTGYTPERAEPHEAAVQEVLTRCQSIGISLVPLPVDGHMPDLAMPNGRLVDVKTSRTKNLAVEEHDFTTWRSLERCGTVVDIWHRHPDGWYRDTPDGLLARASEVRQPTGNGSLDAWRLVHTGGTPILWRPA